MSKGIWKSGDEQPVNAVLDDPFRSRIVAACAEREMSRREFADREGLDFGRMKPKFEALEKAEFLVVRKDIARALRCNMYGTRRAALFMDHEFAQMAPERRFICSRTILSCFRGRFRRAWATGALDSRYASHVSYRILFLDDEGFRELALHFEAALGHQQEVQAASLVRLGEKMPIPATAALFLFESPPRDVLAGGPSRLFSTEDATLPLRTLERRNFTAWSLLGLLRLCASGLRTGTLDHRDDSHMSWAPLLLDEAGFWELEQGFRATRNSVEAMEEASRVRIARSGETPIPVTVGFVSFESPADDAPPRR